MDVTKIYSDFLNMERKAGAVIPGFVMDDGINIWPHLRLGHHQDFYLGEWPRYMQHNFSSLPYVMERRFEFSPSARKRLLASSRPDILVFSNVVCHVENIRGKRYDPYLDPLMTEAQRQGLTALKVAMGHRQPGFLIPPLFLPLTATEPKAQGPDQQPEIPAYEAYFGLCMECGVPPLHAARILRIYTEVNSYAAVFEEILDTLQPRLVVFQEYYNPISMGLVQACRKLGIPSADYQHGLQDWPHIAYNFQWMPKRGYDVVPEWFFMWGAKSAQAMRRQCAAQDFHKVITVGKPNYIAWKHGELRDDPELLSGFSARIEGKIPICVAMPLLADEAEVEALRRVVVQSPADWVWLFRRHPLYDEDEYSVFADHTDKVEREYCSKLNLHTVLTHSRHLVTGCSSAAEEAISLHGMTATSIGDMGRAYFAKGIAQGCIRSAATADEIADSIRAGVSEYPCERYDSIYISKDVTLLGGVLRHLTRG